MEWSAFRLSKRRLRGNLTALHSYPLSQKSVSPPKVSCVQSETIWFLQGGRISNRWLANKIIRTVPSDSRKKASSTEEKQERPSVIHSVKFTSRGWVLKTRLRIERQSSMRKQDHTDIFYGVCFCDKGEDTSPGLLICLFSKYFS